MVTKIDFLLTINNQQKRLRELTKWSLRGKCFDLLSNSFNLLLKECMKINMENLYVDIGAWRVKRNGPHPLWAIGVYKSSDRTKTCCLLRSIQVKFTIAKTLYIVKNPKKTYWGQSPLHCCVPEEGAWQCIRDFYYLFYFYTWHYK